jgi:hypothetical protein
MSGSPLLKGWNPKIGAYLQRGFLMACRTYEVTGPSLLALLLEGGKPAA